MADSSVQIIPLGRLWLMLLPPAVVVFVLMRWSLEPRQAMVAIARMLAQLLLVGYCLVFIFESDASWVVLAVLLVMVSVSSWIALRTVPGRRAHRRDFQRSSEEQESARHPRHLRRRIPPKRQRPFRVPLRARTEAEEPGEERPMR